MPGWHSSRHERMTIAIVALSKKMVRMAWTVLARAGSLLATATRGHYRLAAFCKLLYNHREVRTVG